MLYLLTVVGQVNLQPISSRRGPRRPFEREARGPESRRAHSDHSQRIFNRSLHDGWPLNHLKDSAHPEDRVQEVSGCMGAIGT